MQMSDLRARLRAAFSARASESVDAFEDPQASLEYSLRKLEGNRRELGRAMVEVAAARLRLIEQRDQIANGVRNYRQQAELALRSEREDLARGILERKGELDKRLADIENDLTNLDHQLEIMKQNRLALDNKIEIFQARKEELKSMYESSKAQLRLREALSGISSDLADAGNTIQRIERRIANMRARSAAINQLVSEGVLKDALESESDDIDRQLSQLQRSQAVESELSRLKEEATTPAE
jgi:phage shock protein A